MPFDYGISLQGLDVSNTALEGRLRDWENRVIEALRQTGNTNIDDTLKFSSNIPLKMLPLRQQAEFMREYRQMIGLDQILTDMSRRGTASAAALDYLQSGGTRGTIAEGAGRIWEHLHRIRDVDSGNPYARMPLGNLNENSMIGRIYSMLNLQFDSTARQGKSGIGNVKQVPALPHNLFTIGINSIPRVDTLISGGNSVPNFVANIDPKAKLAIFDIETAGLTRGSIRELAYTVGTSEEMMSGRGAQNLIAFRPSQFMRGLAYDAREGVMNLEQFMGRKYGISVAGLLPDNGSQFVNRMTPFLQTIEDVDYLVGHNIGSFDIDQIFTGLAGTKRYKKDKAFREYVDRMHGTAKAKMIDTLQLARNASSLRELGVDEALSLAGDSRPYSISNLLLKTNLADLMGIDDLDEMILKKGLHHADVDNAVTMALFKNINDLTAGEGIGLAANSLDPKIKRIRKAILNSAAITPFSNIRDTANILPGLLDMHKRGVGITYWDQLVHHGRNFNMDLISGAVPQQPVTAAGLNIFERFKNEGMEVAREKMRAQGVPFIGLSEEERRFGASLSQLTSGIGIGDKRLNRLLTDNLVSRFEAFNPNTIQFTGNRPTMYGQILADAGLLEENKTLLRLSTVEATEQAQKSINLVLGVDNSQMSTLVDRMRLIGGSEDEYVRVMGNANGFQRFREFVNNEDRMASFMERGLKRGITLGQVRGDSEAVEGIFDLLSKTFIVDPGGLNDEQTFRFGLGFLGIDADRGTVSTAGAVVDKIMTEDELRGFATQVQRAGARQTNMIDDIGGNATRVRLLEAEVEGISGFYTKVLRPNARKIGMATLAGSAALLLYNRKKERDKYDFATDYQPSGDTRRYAVADQLQMRLEAGYNGYAQQIDPLATASLTANLWRDRTGHDSMQWDRNTNIYGGIL